MGNLNMSIIDSVTQLLRNPTISGDRCTAQDLTTNAHEKLIAQGLPVVCCAGLPSVIASDV